MLREQTRTESAIDDLPSVRGTVRRRRLTVWAIRVALVAIWLVGWEITATYWIDPFFYSKPTAVWHKLVDWFTVGTSQGSIWEQIAVTLQEAGGGFVLGG